MRWQQQIKRGIFPDYRQIGMREGRNFDVDQFFGTDNWRICNLALFPHGFGKSSFEWFSKFKWFNQSNLIIFKKKRQFSCRISDEISRSEMFDFLTRRNLIKPGGFNPGLSFNVS